MPQPDEPAPPPPRNTCSVCGAPMGVSRLAAQCPRCLLSLGSSFRLPGDAALTEDLLDALQTRSFGDYELLEEIARGGMGIVYRARQTSLRREVAIKMILAGELAGKTALRMFQIEANAAAKLHHPNIVPVYEIGEHKTQHYFTMRFVAGGMTIAGWASERRGDFRAIAAAAAKVARAVAYAHARSILHRDLKPSNILWDAEAGPQVTDFGLAKLLDQADGAITRTPHALGSPSYMAPEQMHGRVAEITTATDVYGIGAILYEMLAGRPPFAGASHLDTMRRAAEEAPAPLPGVPRDLRTICLKCLAKEQEDRYGSAVELAEDLERFARGEPVSVVPLTPPQTLWRWAKRQPRTAALLAICLVLLVAGLSGIVWQWRKAERARAEQARALGRLNWQEIDHWLDEGDAARALAYLASLIHAQPERWQAVMYAMSIVDQTSFPVLAGPEIHPPAKLIGWARFAPDGTWFAGAGEDRVVRIWDAASGKETAQLPQASPVTTLAVAGGSVTLAVATKDGRLAALPTIHAAPLAAQRAASDPIQELGFSADGSRLLARSKDRVEIWPADALGQPPLTLSLGAPAMGASISSDGGRALVWGAREAAVWNTASGQELLRVFAREGFVRGALAADGARVALIDGRFSAMTWDIDSGRQFPPIESQLFYFAQLALNEVGTRLTLAGVSNDLTVFDVESGIPVSPPMQHHFAVFGLESSPNGARTASFGMDDSVKVWDARTGRSLMSAIPFGGGIRKSVGLAFSADGARVLIHTAAQNDAAESISVWSASRNSEPRRRAIPGERVLGSARLSPDARLGALGLSNRCYIYDLATGRVVLEKKVEGEPYANLFSPDARRFYALTGSGWLHGWSLETGEELWEPDHQPGLIRPAALSPDGSSIIAGHNDGHIRIHDTSTGALVRTLDHPGAIRVLRFAPDGSGRFVSGSTDRLAHIWDLKTGRMLQTLAGHTDTIISAAWSPDSRLIATASYDHTARVWDAGTGRPVGAVMNHTGFLAHLEFSPDGALLATACRDGYARLWNPRTGQPASPPLLQGSACETVRFTGDGAALLVWDHSGFRFWDSATAQPVTIHYREPAISGIGLDAESHRAIMSSDGRIVLLGHSMSHAALWSIDQPRGRAPAWLADFLESLAQVRLGERGESQPVRRETAGALAEQIRRAPASDEYAAWALRILDAAGK